MSRLLLITLVLWALPLLAQAAVIDATEAEALYQSGDYKGARTAFVELLGEFSTASKDSGDYRSYRELAYLYDRLADCCFTQRDWPALKLYLDGLLQATGAELSLVEEQLTGALFSGVATATARVLYARVDESVRLSSLARIKRGIGLVLFDTDGQGSIGEGAVRQYQQLAAATTGVIEVEDGMLHLNIVRLEQNLDAFDKVRAALEQLADIEALWEKYPPPGAVQEENSDAEE